MYLYDIDKKMDTTRYYEQTKYQDIFKNTYWGSFTSSPNHYPPDLKTCCENRNKFIEDNSIKSCVTWNNRFSKKREFFHIVHRRIEATGVVVDHSEYYDTGYSVIGISSHHCYDHQHAIWQKYGFRRIDPLYSMDQSTYMYEYFYK
jgi:hypothetical protein